MRKAIVVVALILLLVGIVSAVSIQESRTEESVLDRWIIAPPKLYPTNVTGWAFMLTSSGGAFLELDIVASDVVRVIVGILTPYQTWEKVVFNGTGTRFAQRITIADANFVEIKNEGINIVDISGDIEKIGNIRQTSYLYLGLGTLTAVFGLILLIYGVSAKPRKSVLKRNRTYALGLSDVKFF